MPVPLMFFAVLAVVLALIIFFGAWAVSVDASNQRTLAFGLPGTTPTLSGGNLREENSGPYQVARLASAVENSDTWWGKAFLKACPLH